MDEGELEDPDTGELRIFYLCKWNSQFYDQCTWEKEEDVEKVRRMVGKREKYGFGLHILSLSWMRARSKNSRYGVSFLRSKSNPILLDLISVGL